MMTTQGRVWFVTGAGRGIGRAIAQAVLDAGDQVVATARRPEALDGLVREHGDRIVPVQLDVDDRAAVVHTVDEAVRMLGRIDVVVNNAGWGLMGAIEEIGEHDARAQMDTNFFGALWVTQAVLPHMRAQRSGHLIQVSTVGAIGTFPTLGLYNASKWALEGFSEALAGEVAPFGIRVTIVEPGGFATEWATTSMRTAAPLAAYDPLRASLFDADASAAADRNGDREDCDAGVEGDPVDLAMALLEVADSEPGPLRVLIGGDAPRAAQMALEMRRDQYEQDAGFSWPVPTRARASVVPDDAA